MNIDEIHVLPEADTSNIKRKFLDIPYGNQSDFQKLDIYLPDTGDGLFPVIVFIHGGAWSVCDKADTQIQPFLELVSQGYAVVSLNYRLSGEATFPAGFEDCKEAFYFLKTNAGQYHLNSGRMALAGESSGAYYVLMLVGAKVPVKCALSLYAVTDIENLYGQMIANGQHGFVHSDATSPESRYMGEAIAKISSGRLKEASPIYHIWKGMPPVLLQHGCKDRMVAHQQSVTYYEKVRAIAGDHKATLELFKDADHSDPVFSQPENKKRIKKFFDSNL